MFLVICIYNEKLLNERHALADRLIAAALINPS